MVDFIYIGGKYKLNVRGVHNIYYSTTMVSRYLQKYTALKRGRRNAVVLNSDLQTIHQENQISFEIRQILNISQKKGSLKSKSNPIIFQTNNNHIMKRMLLCQ